MRGIEITNLENIINRTSNLNNSIGSIIERIERQVSLTESTVRGDLCFLMDNIRFEISQFNIIKDNNSQYDVILGEVIKSYQSQSTRLQSAVSSVTPHN